METSEKIEDVLNSMIYSAFDVSLDASIDVFIFCASVYDRCSGFFGNIITRMFRLFFLSVSPRCPGLVSVREHAPHLCKTGAKQCVKILTPILATNSTRSLWHIPQLHVVASIGYIVEKNVESGLLWCDFMSKHENIARKTEDIMAGIAAMVTLS